MLYLQGKLKEELGITKRERINKRETKKESLIPLAVFLGMTLIAVGVFYVG